MLKFLDLVPSWVYALALAAAVAFIMVLGLQLSGERLHVAQLNEKIERERGAAQRELAVATNRVLVAERNLRTSRAEQEKKDGDAQTTIADLGERLRRAAAAPGGLRDRFAAPCDRQPPAGSGPVAGPGGENPAEAGRALSPEFSGAVVALLRDADDINAAYASCRADAVGLRAQLRSLSPPGGATSAP